MAYIKLEDALQVCSEAEEWYTETNEQQCAVVSDDIYQQIANLPTADVVEVVKCKDCEHYDISGWSGHERWCKCLFKFMRKDDFCSRGERRTDDEQV